MIRDDLMKQVHQKFPIPLTRDQITGQGSAFLAQYLKTRYGSAPSSADIREQIGVAWVEVKPACYGKLPCRVGQYMSKFLHIKIDEEALGNALQKYRVNLKSGFYDFDHEIEWEGGDFGDVESCFTGPNADGSAVRTLREFGFMALRLWRTQTKGFARCWIGFDEAHDNCILFNPYGARLVDMAEILRLHIKADTIEHILLGITGAASLYVNENSTGFYVVRGDWKPANHFDLVLSWHPKTCRICGKPWDREGEWFVDDSRRYAVCPACLETHTQCDYCGAWVDKAATHSVVGCTYCERCFGRNFTKCALCGDLTSRNYIVVKGGERLAVCPRCYAAYTTHCPLCGHRCAEPLVEAEGYRMCTCCLNDYGFRLCDKCHLWHRDDTPCVAVPLAEGCRVRVRLKPGQGRPYYGALGSAMAETGILAELYSSYSYVDFPSVTGVQVRNDELVVVTDPVYTPHVGDKVRVRLPSRRREPRYSWGPWREHRDAVCTVTRITRTAIIIQPPQDVHDGEWWAGLDELELVEPAIHVTALTEVAPAMAYA